MISDLTGIPAEQLAAIEAAYAKPVRAYHHFGHALDVLARADEVATGPGWTREAEIRMAILYHDAIYAPGRRDSEQRSADLAREHLRRWPRGVDIERVAELVLLTARHGRLQPADVDADAALFLDCDMAILAAPPAQFDASGLVVRERIPGRAQPRGGCAGRKVEAGVAEEDARCRHSRDARHGGHAPAAGFLHHGARPV
jgi:predicted metal-dependent HD superfamily phosphohydrolase